MHRVTPCLSGLCLVLCAAAGCASTPAPLLPSDPEATLPLEFPRAPPSIDALAAWYDARPDRRVGSFNADGDVVYVEVAHDTEATERVAFLVDVKRMMTTTVIAFAPPRTQRLPWGSKRVGWLCDQPIVEVAFQGEQRWWIEAVGAWLSVPSAVDMERLGITKTARTCAIAEQRWPSRATPLAAPSELKTTVHTFDRDHAYALDEGRLWMKRRAPALGRVEPWRLMHAGVPRTNDGEIVEPAPQRLIAVGADGDELIGVDQRGRVYTHTTESASMMSRHGWTSGWGYPGKRPLVLQTPLPRFALGRRSTHATFHEDPVGNARNIGPMGTTTLYVLSEDGRTVRYTDNGLPPDLTRTMCLPADNRVSFQAISASASAVMGLDRYGRVFTQFFDYDLNGGTPFFSFSYRDDVDIDADRDHGLSMRSAFADRQLPLADWVWHAPLPLADGTRVARAVTVVQTGEGNAARELRVGAVDASGRLGFFSKGIEEERWRFVPSPAAAFPSGETWLSAADLEAGVRDFETARGEIRQSALLAPARSPQVLRGSLWTAAPRDGELDWRPSDVHLEIDAVDPTCGPARIRVNARGRTFEMLLHTADLWTPSIRHGASGDDVLGTDAHAVHLQGTLVIPPAALRSQDPTIRAVIKEHFRAWHQRTFSLWVEVTDAGWIVESDLGVDGPSPLRFELRAPGAPPELDVPAALVEAERRELAGAVDANDPAVRDARERLLMELARHDRQIREAETYLAEAQAMLFVAGAVPIGALPRLPRVVSRQVERDPYAAPGRRARVIAAIVALGGRAPGAPDAESAEKAARGQCPFARRLKGCGQVVPHPRHRSLFDEVERRAHRHGAGQHDDAGNEEHRVHLPKSRDDSVSRKYRAASGTHP